LGVQAVRKGNLAKVRKLPTAEETNAEVFPLKMSCKEAAVKGAALGNPLWKGETFDAGAFDIFKVSLKKATWQHFGKVLLNAKGYRRTQ
jgi:hypothetical protein